MVVNFFYIYNYFFLNYIATVFLYCDVLYNNVIMVNVLLHIFSFHKKPHISEYTIFREVQKM